MSDYNPVLSVIVPVYKVENFIGRCLNSIIAQTFTDWECIIVDDGSPDNCGKICDEYAQHDARIKVIHQKMVAFQQQEIREWNSSEENF